MDFRAARALAKSKLLSEANLLRDSGEEIEGQKIFIRSPTIATHRKVSEESIKLGPKGEIQKMDLKKMHSMVLASCICWEDGEAIFEVANAEEAFERLGKNSQVQRLLELAMEAFNGDPVGAEKKSEATTSGGSVSSLPKSSAE
jgi:hypothetical protein